MFGLKRLFFGLSAAGCLVGLSADFAAGPRWAAGPLSAGEMNRIRGGAGACYVENNSPCSFVAQAGPCRGTAPGPSGPCNPDVGRYQTVETLHRVKNDVAGKSDKFSGEPVWCYNKYQCKTEMNGTDWNCVQGAYIDHSDEYVEEFPSGTTCASE